MSDFEEKDLEKEENDTEIEEVKERIIELQEEKKKLIDKIVGEEVNLGENFNSLSEKEVLSFFEKN